MSIPSKFPEPGDLFEGRYLIKQVIGAGGFSRVYQATQQGVEREVAIKLLNPQMNVGSITEEERENKLALVAQRFKREAKLVSRLHDSHTVTMHDYGRTEAGHLYMVLEFVEGLTISGLIQRDGALSPKRAVKILTQVLHSLQEAHAMNVLHRDIKPANIMVYDHVGRSDQVKVLDFGIAKGLGDSGATAKQLTRDGVLLGTPRYMSPEQIRGDKLGPFTDIYSLGLVGFELLVGVKAVQAENSMNIIARHLDPNPIRLPTDWKGPKALRQVITRMVAKDSAQRYCSCDEVLADLELWEADALLTSATTVRLTPVQSEDDGLADTIKDLSTPLALVKATLRDMDASETMRLPTPTNKIPSKSATSHRGPSKRVTTHRVPAKAAPKKTVQEKPIEIIDTEESDDDLLTAPPPSKPTPAKPAKKDRTRLMVGVLLATIALAIFVGYQVFGTSPRAEPIDATTSADTDQGNEQAASPHALDAGQPTLVIVDKIDLDESPAETEPQGIEDAENKAITIAENLQEKAPVVATQPPITSKVKRSKRKRARSKRSTTTSRAKKTASKKDEPKKVQFKPLPE